MVKKEMITVDYSKLSLFDVIRCKTKRKCTFNELEEEDKIGVLKYIKAHNIGLMIIGKRGYNILSRKFYANEYILSDEIQDDPDEMDICVHSFDNFTNFYTFLKGDIYEVSCFFGYNFSNDEINKYSLDLNKINFDSFILETIDDYSFDKLNEDDKIPLGRNYSRYIIEKNYYEGVFYVKQTWLDSKGQVIKSDNHDFDMFCDFVHFLKNDISNADLIMCVGIENISTLDNLNINDIKVRSIAAIALNLPLNRITRKKIELKEFNESLNFELETKSVFELQKKEYDDNYNNISYISDIHLMHRFEAYHCQTFEDVNYVIRLFSKKLSEQATSINLITGDISSDFKAFYYFFGNLALMSFFRIQYFLTLGNHELWDPKFSKMTLDEIISEYREKLTKIGNENLHLVHNNLFYLDDEHVWNEVSTDALMSVTPCDLRKKMRGAKLIIFGGIGFAGKNSNFNANSGIYLNVLNREEEINESNNFFQLYEKVTESLKGMNLIVMTHMPLKDWAGHEKYKDGIIYVSGHNHRNYYNDDGKIRIYADNQLGYKGKNINFKSFSVELGYNWFNDYKDGIYEISREDYIKFYRGINENVTFNRDFVNLYMIKSKKTYMFLLKTNKGPLKILNGGSIKNVCKQDLNYFYDNLLKYSKSVSMFLSKYDSFQKKVSKEIKLIGGSGTIHGCIVDIDYNNHLYINPLDGKITAYYAKSMTEKYVYNSLTSLLKYKCPNLYLNFEKLLVDNNSNSLVIYNQNLPISKEWTFVPETYMYKTSRIIKGLQFTTEYNIVRIWNDNFVQEPSVENGRLIVSSIINLDLISKNNKQK